MIVGLATVLQTVADVRREFAADPELKAKVFTRTEIDYCEKKRYPEVHYAARWAAKKAAIQALGRTESDWLEVQTRNSENGCPTLDLEGSTKRAADLLGVKRVFISLTHTRDLAAAMVVLEH